MARSRILPLLLLVAALACAKEAKLPWSGLERHAPEPDPALDVSLPPASSLPPSLAPAKASAYPPPPGGLLLATFDGPVAPPVSRLSSLADELLGGDHEILGSLEADVDGDGTMETAVLAKEAGGPFLLAAIAGEGIVSSRRYEGEWDRGGRCHQELRLLGKLRGEGGDALLVWEDRGVGCAAFEGGGFERYLHVVSLSPGREGEMSHLLGRMRMIEAGAVDAYDGAAWIVPWRDGSERIAARGVFSARRRCSLGDAPFWVEELAFRVGRERGEIVAWTGAGTLLLPEGVLPPELLRSHVSGCF